MQVVLTPFNINSFTWKFIYMQRRKFFKTAVLGSVSAALLPDLNSPELYDQDAKKAVSPIKITKIRYYSAPGYNKPLSIRPVEL